MSSCCTNSHGLKTHSEPVYRASHTLLYPKFTHTSTRRALKANQRNFSFMRSASPFCWRALPPFPFSVYRLLGHAQGVRFTAFEDSKSGRKTTPGEAKLSLNFVVLFLQDVRVLRGHGAVSLRGGGAGPGARIGDEREGLRHEGLRSCSQ